MTFKSFGKNFEFTSRFFPFQEKSVISYWATTAHKSSDYFWEFKNKNVICVHGSKFGLPCIRVGLMMNENTIFLFERHVRKWFSFF